MEQLPHIEGLDEFTDHDLSMENDTPPDAIIVWFDVVKEYMPFLSEQSGERVYQNFVHRFYIKELGYSSGSRRIKDLVAYDKETERWRVKKLATAGQSDIKKFPHEWNKFFNGNTGEISGTPIDLLFKHDPARADMYKVNHIDSIERLAGLSDGDCQRGGMGWLDDRTRARTFLAKARENAGGIQNVSRIQKLEEENQTLKSTVKDLMEKLDIVLADSIRARQEAMGAMTVGPVEASEAPKKKRGRPAKVETADDGTHIEGLEDSVIDLRGK